MGTVFGKQSVAEPAYDVLATHSAQFSYEVRRYGVRFAAKTSYMTDGDEKSDNTPFMLLAKYIGVFGTPENEGQQAISMTAPVIKQSEGGAAEPVKIAMTAPVMKQGAQSGDDTQKTMAFVLPAEFDAMSKIPKPTNPRVHIEEIPSQVGVVHRFSGSFSDDLSEEKAQALAEQLRQDGLVDMTNEHVLQQYQWFGYNPPFTLPMFRRNEIWVELSEEQANILINGIDTKTAN